jgi:hypothetical protein
MKAMKTVCLFLSLLLLPTDLLGQGPQGLVQAPNTWVKRSPLPGGPPNPVLGYEASFGYDPVGKKIIRWAGHTQSGGHEQLNETWTYDPLTAEFKLLETNTAPPGVCCAPQDVFDPVGGRFLRFRASSGLHGWHWFRENNLSNSSVWSFDPAKQHWRTMRPLPEPFVAHLRCASWDSEHQVVVVFGGEGSFEGTLVYDPYDNTWTRKNPKMQPPFRSAGNMAYDSRRKRHILFGAQYTDDPHTWAYNLADNVWIDLQPKVQPPTNSNEAVLAYDESNDVIVASVKSSAKEDGPGSYETWVYDADANTWKNMKPKESPPGCAPRRRIMAYVPDLNVIVMENYVNPPQKVPGVDREQQMWTYRYAEPKEMPKAVSKKAARARPPLVEGLVASVLTGQKVQLTWQSSAGVDVVGYQVERAAVEVLTEDQLLRLRTDTRPLPEPSVGGIRAIGAFQRLTKAAIPQTTFDDTTIDLTRLAVIDTQPIFRQRFAEEQVTGDGKKYRFAVYAYRVRAVNRQGLESGPSPYVLTIPSAVQYLFSKEAGVDCQLKWQKNPEAGIKGYRVYRMESPRINGPGQKVTRVTAEPIAETTFIDRGIGKEQRRYWVVAVDALGQEGQPSAPTWHYRLFRSYYEPFVGEWHQ